jgi:arsenate reductase
VKITLYHNPRCSKSRNALQWLKERNVELEIVDYLNQAPSIESLRSLGEKLGLDPRHWVRKEEEEYRLYLKGKDLSDDEIYRLMHQYPKLIQRPIVVWSDRAVVARPLEHLMDALGNAN